MWSPSDLPGYYLIVVISVFFHSETSWTPARVFFSSCKKHISKYKEHKLLFLSASICSSPPLLGDSIQFPVSSHVLSLTASSSRCARSLLSLTNPLAPLSISVNRGCVTFLLFVAKLHFFAHSLLPGSTFCSSACLFSTSCLGETDTSCKGTTTVNND